MLLGILNFIIDDDEARAIVHRLLDPVPSGSYLAIAHPTKEVHGDAMEEAVRRWNEDGSFQLTLRSRQELAGFFDRLETAGARRGLVFAVATRPWRSEIPS
jgi:hypothetical protein